MSAGVIGRRPRPLESHPLPQWLQFYVERYAGRVPRWMFPHLPPTAELRFERLDFDNRGWVLDMFEGDTCPFIDPAFRNDEKLYTYVANQWICGPHSAKHGCADWVVIRQSDGEPTGLLHAYALNSERFDLADRRCFIGYAFGEAYRGSGFAHEAVTALESYLFDELEMATLVANPIDENKCSIGFLQRRGYADCTQEYLGQDGSRFFKLERGVEG